MAKEYKELKIAFEQLRSLKIAPETRTVGLTGQDQLIAWAGGRFAVMNEWFFDPYILDFPMPPDFTAATSLTRYTDPTSTQEGLVAELWSSLSTDLRDALANADRHAEFKRIVSHLQIKSKFLSLTPSFIVVRHVQAVAL